MKLTLATAERSYFDGEIREVLLPTLEGEIAVLPGHAPFVVALKPGVLEVRPQTGDWHHFSLTGGMAEILPDKLSVLAIGVDVADDLDEQAIKEARERALHARANAQGDEEYALAMSALERAMAQEKTLERRKRWRTK